MLIIFDLDDTLIDTSKGVTPFQIRRALSVLSLEDREEEAFQFNISLGRARLALSALGKRYGRSKELIQKAEETLFSPLPSDFVVPKTPGADEILNFLYQEGHPLVLVTAGKDRFQREKLEKAGLDPSFFSMMAVSEEGGKRPFYEAALKKFLSRPAFVCGDRIEADLRPGYALGLKTIHVRWGRGAFEPRAEWVDHSIETLYELKGILR